MKFFTLIVLLMPALWAQPEPQPQAQNVLTFKTFLSKTLKHDPSFQRLLLSRLYLKYAEDLGLPPSDLLLEVQAEYGFFRETEEDRVVSDPGARVTLTKLFPQTGTEVSASYAKISAATTGLNRYVSTLGVQVSQSILRNSFGRSTRKLKKQIQIETRVARHQIVEAYEDYLSFLLVIYLDWFRAEKRREAALKTLQEEEQVYKLTLRKRRLRVAYNDEVQRANLAVLVAKAQLEAASAEEYNRKLQIAQLSGEKFENLGKSVAIDFDKSFSRVNKKQISRTEKILNLLKVAGMLEREIAADALLPSARLFAGYDVLSRNFSFTRPDHRVYVGLNFGLNFTRQIEKAQHEVALLDEKDIKLQNKQTLLNLTTDVKIIDNHVASIAKVVALAEERLKVAATVARALQRKYNLGQANITDLATARRDLVSARVNLIEQLANQAELRLEQLRLRDILVYKLPTRAK